jgi:hypothetical protein
MRFSMVLAYVKDREEAGSHVDKQMMMNMTQ